MKKLKWINFEIKMKTRILIKLKELKWGNKKRNKRMTKESKRDA